MQILQYKDHFIVKLNNSELVAPTVSNVINITQDSKIYNEIQLVVLNSKLVQIKNDTLDDSLDDFIVDRKSLNEDIRAGDGKIRCF